MTMTMTAAAIEGRGRPNRAIRSATRSVPHSSIDGFGAGAGAGGCFVDMFAMVKVGGAEVDQGVRPGLAARVAGVGGTYNYYFYFYDQGVSTSRQHVTRRPGTGSPLAGLDLSSIDTAPLTRQVEWRERAAERSAAERQRRLRRLEDSEEALTRATRAYANLPWPSVSLRLRVGFVALDPPRQYQHSGDGEVRRPRQQVLEDERDARPLMTRLVATTSRALPTYLSLLYVLNAERGASPQVARMNASRTAGGPESWAVLCGRWASSQRARRTRLMRDLDALAAVDLVALKRGGGRKLYEEFVVLSDDTGDARYSPPTRSEATVPLPSRLYLNGWHLVLTPAELATLIVIRHAWRKAARATTAAGVGIPASKRWSTYGVSGEAYSAIHELEEFGLIAIDDPMPNRRRGKIRTPSAEERAQLESDGVSLAPETYRLAPRGDDCFDRPALPVVNACLSQRPVAPRLV